MAGARAHNRWLADFCADEPAPPHRRGRHPHHRRHRGRRCRDPRPRPSRAAGRHDPDPLVRRSRPTTTRSTSPSGRPAPRPGMVLHTHSGAGPADYEPRPRLRRDLRHRGVVVGGPPVLGAPAVGRLRAPPRACKYVIAENGAWWVPDLVSRMDEKWVGGAQHPQVRRRLQARPRPLKPSEYVDRNCFFAASTPGVDEIDRRHEIGIGNLLWGNDLPAPRGHLPPHPEVDQRALPRRPRGRGRRDPRRQRRRALPGRHRRRWPRSSSASARPSTRSTAPSHSRLHRSPEAVT